MNFVEPIKELIRALFVCLVIISILQDLVFLVIIGYRVVPIVILSIVVFA